MALQVAGQSIHGTMPVVVGGRTYFVPEDSQVQKIHRGRGRLAYVKDAGGIMCLTGQGEISIPQALQELIANKNFGTHQLS